MMEIIMQIIFYVNLEKLDFTTYYISNLFFLDSYIALTGYVVALCAACIITSLNSCFCSSVNESKKRFCSLATD